jgi:excisionase family DNA binding protein
LDFRDHLVLTPLRIMLCEAGNLPQKAKPSCIMRRARTDDQAPAPERLYYRPKEVAALTGLGLRTVYADVYAGIIPSPKIGDARLIPASWLLARTDADAEEIRQALAPPARRYSPKNRYSLGKSPRDRRGLSRLLRIAFSQHMRMRIGA